MKRPKAVYVGEPDSFGGSRMHRSSTARALRSGVQGGIVAGLVFLSLAHTARAETPVERGAYGQVRIGLGVQAGLGGVAGLGQQIVLQKFVHRRGSGRRGIGALLRREGLYSSHLVTWRRERQAGILEALKPRKRGRRAERHPLRTEENQKLRRQVGQLTEKLRKAELIIEVQKKVAALLGNPIPDVDPEEKS